MICGPWRADLAPGVYRILGANTYRGNWREGWRRIVREDPCAWCGGPGGSLDHIEPRSLTRPGRRRSWTNLTGSCFACNEYRGDVGVLQFLADPERARAVALATRSKTKYRHKNRKQLLKKLVVLLHARAWRLEDANGDRARRARGTEIPRARGPSSTNTERDGRQ